MTGNTVIQASHLFKQFNGTVVLHQVDLDLREGEIHALMGENGAGKSTMIKILSGVYQPDGGTINFDGQPTTLSNPSKAHQLGIYTVHQEPAMMPELTVAENIFMGFHPTRRFGIRIINRRDMYEKAENLFQRLGISLNVKLKASELSIAQQQMVEIAKALVHKVRVLILDEPTATLSAHETQILFEIVRKLKSEGTAILFISHRLEEVFSLCSRMTVLRDGAKVGTYSTDELDENKLVKLMVGREVELNRFRHQVIERNQPYLTVNMMSKEPYFRDVSFSIYPGEILGFAGLVGAGRTNVAEAIFGIVPADKGEIALNGKPVELRSVSQAIDQGIVYVPEDRHRHGVALQMDIASNISVPSLKALSKNGVINQAEELQLAKRMAENTNLRHTSVRQKVGELSGGNQQKVVLSKWISRNPKIVILDEPTRGVDVGAKKEIHRMVDEIASGGAAVMLISSDLPELLNLADRVIVMREGRVVAEVTREEMNEEVIAAYATGVRGKVKQKQTV